jgi:hypothetical protein
LDLWVPGRASRFRAISPAHITDACDNTLPSLSCLPNVHTVIFSNAPMGIWPALLDKVFQGPSLKALEWRSSPWRSLEHNAFSSLTHYPPLRRITYEVQKPYPVLHRANLDTASEEAALYSIFEHVSAHVEQLALPGETVNFGMMAGLNWSSLRELVLVGRASLHDRPLITLLVNLVELRVLDLQISFSSNFFVWPPDFELSPADVNAPRALLPMLEILSLTNADPTDLILRHIPPSVTTLSLVPYPRSFVTRYDGVLITSLSPTVAMKAEDIITVLTNNDVSSLTTLRVSVYGALASRLFRTISSSCSILQTLEVFHRRGVSLEDVDESCVCPASSLWVFFFFAYSLHVVRHRICAVVYESAAYVANRVRLFRCTGKSLALFVGRRIRLSAVLGDVFTEGYKYRYAGEFKFATACVFEEACGEGFLVQL